MIEESYAKLLARGHALAWEGQWDEAVEVFRRAAERWPEDAATQGAYGLACLHLGQMEEAARALEAASWLAPPDGVLLERLAEAYRELGEKRKAAAALAQMAEALGQAGEPERAVEAIRQAAELDPEDEGHGRRLAEWLARTGRTEEVVAAPAPESSAAATEGQDLADAARAELLDWLFAPDGPDTRGWLPLGRGLEAHLEGRVAEAAQAFAAALQAGLERPALRYLTGLSLLEAGGQESPIAHLESVSTHARYGPAASTILVRVHVARGDTERAAGYLVGYVRRLDLGWGDGDRRQALAERYDRLPIAHAAEPLQELLTVADLDQRLTELRQRLDRMSAVAELTVLEGLLLEAQGGILSALEESYRWASRGNLIQAREVCQNALESHSEVLALQRRLAELSEAEGRATDAREKYLHLGRVYDLRGDESLAQWCQATAQRLVSAQKAAP